MALTLCEHACKTVCDVKLGIDPCPSPACGHETKRIKFQVVLLLEKNSDVAKNVKSLLEQLQVCIFAEIVFGVRCT